MKRIILKSVAAMLSFMFLVTILVSCGGVPASLTENGNGENYDITTNFPLDLDPDSRLEHVGGAVKADTADTVCVKLHYLTDDGYMVPVRKNIEKQSGIARACLELLVDGGENRIELMKNGLVAPLPADSKFDIAIKNGEAIVDVKTETIIDSEDRARDIVTAIVDTLIEFKTVECVSITINGSRELTNLSVYLPEKSEQIPLNIEDSALMTAANTQEITLYFPNNSGSLLVPITRYIDAKPSIYAVVNALAAGTALNGLINVFPNGTLVLGAAQENGVLTVNLTKEFARITEIDGMYDLAMQAVLFSAAPYTMIDEIRFTVNGEPFEP
ncbi:MAG: GerMN domain-containing protein [Clostridia bacterium]|nr:GerMN domain-containing protein [Clostridia bacterium]